LPGQSRLLLLQVAVAGVAVVEVLAVVLLRAARVAPAVRQRLQANPSKGNGGFVIGELISTICYLRNEKYLK